MMHSSVSDKDCEPSPNHLLLILFNVKEATHSSQRGKNLWSQRMLNRNLSSMWNSSPNKVSVENSLFTFVKETKSTFVTSPDERVVSLEFRHHSAGRAGAAGTIPCPMYLGASMARLRRQISPLSHLLQQHYRRPNGTAHLSQASATGITRKKMTSTGSGSQEVLLPSEQDRHQTTQQEV